LYKGAPVDKYSSRVLLVEDKSSLSDMLSEFLSDKGMAVDVARSVKEALSLYQIGAYQMVLLDLKLPDGTGIDILRKIHQIHPAQPIILMTAYGTIEDSVEAMKLGAIDFIQKPVNLNQLYSKIVHGIEFYRLKTEVLLYREAFRNARNLPPIISKSSVMNKVAREVQKIAQTDLTVFLTGESGTGKELFAKTIHLLSPRKNSPFVEVNCAAIPETLIENELFGHVKGAYTGADSSTMGKFELASGGTLFLDEIGDLPLQMQAKLLKALEEKKIWPIGAKRPVLVDVRIVAATNRDIEALVDEGRFREDLFYRLGQFPVEIPPLRERKEDILPLAEFFLSEAAMRYNQHVRKFSQDAITEMLSYHWPGNIRELKNLVDRAVIIDDDGIIDSKDLFLQVVSSSDALIKISVEDIKEIGLKKWLENIESIALKRVLEIVGDSIDEASAWLGMKKEKLINKLKSLSLLK